MSDTQRTSFGTRGSQVQILPLRPSFPEACPLTGTDCGTETPVSAKPQVIPTDPKARASVPSAGQSKASRDFERWLTANASKLGPDLYAKALRVHLSLRTANQTAWSQSAALQDLTKADVSAFTTAYAQHMGGQ